MAFSKIIAESMDLTDAYNFTGTLQQNGAGIGGDNEPYFFLTGVSSSQTLSTDTFTTLTNWNTPTKSSQGTFSSGVYTPGVVGKYFIYTAVDIGNMADSDRCFCIIQADNDGNGSFSQKGTTGKDISGHVNADITTQTSIIIDCTANTQIRVQGWHEFGSNKNHQGGVFQGFKLIT